MGNTMKKQVAIQEDFWSVPGTDETPHLIGSHCSGCGEIYFPRKEKNWCLQCFKPALEDIRLSRRGKIATFSVVMQQPGGGFYQGPVPYAYGCVDLPDGVRIKTLFATDDFDMLSIGKEVELVIEKLHEDEEGNDVLTFKFRPI